MSVIRDASTFRDVARDVRTFAIIGAKRMVLFDVTAAAKLESTSSLKDAVTL